MNATIALMLKPMIERGSQKHKIAPLWVQFPFIGRKIVENFALFFRLVNTDSPKKRNLFRELGKF
jgi:hypothetical protein